MSNINFLPENKHHLVLSITALTLTISSFVIISMSLQAAYLWLVVVLIVMLFFTTFTCSSTMHWQRNSAPITTNTPQDISVNNTQVCWVIDVPPSYRLATGLPSGETPPPSYRKLGGSPPPYNDPDIKSESRKSSIDFNIKTIPEIQADSIPEVFSNLHTTRTNNIH